tara:strand:- start:136298 stop:137362 length:1065 start_codon:yes stop_codon:yes gene_type:complete
VNLLTPLDLGALHLRNRIVMAPMTRSRSDAAAMPNALMAEYYRQRASAGLIVTEGIAPSANGLGYCRTPGIFTDAQVTGWREVTDAVHAEGGCIVAQIMHVGRVASHYNKPEGSETVAPSAVAAKAQMYTDAAGMQAMDEPRALALEEIPAVIEEYREATRKALLAGFDGVELHCTSGYLPAQFLSTGSNQRTDAYGGSVENRARFALEALQAMAQVAGADRVGMRICPGNPFNDLSDADPQETFDYLLAQASTLGLAYLHVIRMPTGPVDNLALAAKHFAGCLIGNESYSLQEADEAVAAGELAAVSFGRPYIGNPDLVTRWEQGLPLAKFDIDTLYTPGPEGYTTYPAADHR